MTAAVPATRPVGGRRRRLRRWALALTALFVLSLAWPEMFFLDPGAEIAD